jgi:6-O-methylguanine DNA methyltransferase, DNA binding domain
MKLLIDRIESPMGTIVLISNGDRCVMRAHSKLTGYAGGLARKQWLLDHEGVALRSDKDR